jgi:lysozyme family protein
MLEKISQEYKELKVKIAELVREAELNLAGRPGPEKRKWIIQTLDSAIPLARLWDDVLNVDGLVIGYLVDKICDTWNTLTDGHIDTLGVPADIAEVVDASAAALASVVEKHKTVDERIAELYKSYDIKPTATTGIVSKPAASVPAVTNKILSEKNTEKENWQRCLNLVFGHEGGLNNNPKDKGGLTNLGVTHGTLRTANALGLVKQTDVKKLTREEAAIIYRKLYWEKASADKMIWSACYLAFDAIVNGGLGMFADCFQKALNEVFKAGLVEDNKWGKLSQAATLKYLGMDTQVNADAVNKFATACLKYRWARYQRIIKADKSQKEFENGWRNRLIKVAKGIKCNLPAGL